MNNNHQSHSLLNYNEEITLEGGILVHLYGRFPGNQQRGHHLICL